MDHPAKIAYAWIGRIEAERRGRAWRLGELVETRKDLGLLGIPFAAALFAGDLSINLVGIGFPITWHPDELGKAAQVQTGNYNFFHPQLLLRLTEAARYFNQPDDTTRTLILTGRVVSAAATAAAVTLFGILVARRFGLLFGTAAALLVAIAPPVFVNAHFFKEDATLLLGCALVLLALQAFELNPTSRNTVLLGIAVGVACSAKYVGILMLIAALATIGLVGNRRRVIVVCAAAAITFALINVSAFLRPYSFVKGLGAEIIHVASSHGGVQFGPTSSATAKLFLRDTPLVLVLLWAGGLAWMAWNSAFGRRLESAGQITRFEIALFTTPLLFLATLQLSMVVLPRYLMPISAMVTVASVWMLARFSIEGPVRIARATTAVLLCVAAAATIPSFIATSSIFVDPPRLRLAKWIADNVPPTARMAADFYTGIPDTRSAGLDPTLPRLPQAVQIVQPVPVDDGLSIESLRSAGFTHVVTAGGNYERLFDPAGRIVWQASEKRKRYYMEVLGSLRLLHEEPAGTDLDELFASRMAVYDLRK